jgi:ABC-type branched-subunit amino acid transport system permease subunit
MTTIAGLPAHVLLVHAIVVLAPLTAALEILCAIWPAARRRLVWLVLAFAAVNLVFTPLTTDAGEWLLNQRSQVSAVLQAHWLEGRSDKRRTVAPVVVAILALVVGVSSIITVVRIGDSGAHSVWGGAA